jgi:hypothetical protein
MFAHENGNALSPVPPEQRKHLSMPEYCYEWLTPPAQTPDVFPVHLLDAPGSRENAQRDSPNPHSPTQFAVTPALAGFRVAAH